MTVAVCVKTSMDTIAPHLHDTDTNKPSTGDNPQEEDKTHAAVTNAGSLQAPDPPNEDEAITTSAGDGKDESIPTEKGGAEYTQSSANVVDKDAAGNTAEEERDAAATNQDDHDDHIVEGEEDTVIY